MRPPVRVHAASTYIIAIFLPLHLRRRRPTLKRLRLHLYIYTYTTHTLQVPIYTRIPLHIYACVPYIYPCVLIYAIRGVQGNGPEYTREFQKFLLLSRRPQHAGARVYGKLLRSFFLSLSSPPIVSVHMV